MGCADWDPSRILFFNFLTLEKNSDLTEGNRSSFADVVGLCG